MTPQPTPPSDTLARGIRTAAQTLIASLIVGGLTYLEGLDLSKGIPDVDALKLAGGMILTTALVSLAHNWLESQGILPPLGKATPLEPQTIQVLQAIPPPVQQLVITHRVEQVPAPTMTPADSAPPALVLPTTVTPGEPTPPVASTPG